MNDTPLPKELRFKRGSHILGYMRQFSATEKFIFGALAIVAFVTAIMMAANVNAYFSTTIPAYGGELREGVVGLPRTVSPVLAITDVDRDLSSLVYAGLTRYDGTSIVPDIAKSWTVSDDGLTYSFMLRPNVRFQDGTLLTADDVAFTIQKVQDSALKSPHRADWSNVTVQEISPSEIHFILKQPYSPFLTNTTIGIMPKHIWANVSTDQFIFSQYNISPIGSGPYKISSVINDKGGIPTEYRLSTWSGYYGTVPYISSVTFKFFGDDGKALAALDSGVIDSLSSIAPADAARLATDSAQAYKVLSAPLPRIFGVFFNQSQAPALADKNVRTALDMSVDRNAIVKAVLSGYGVPIDGPLPTGFPGADTQPAGGADISGAQALLEKNGWKKNAAGIYEKKTGKITQDLAFDIYTADTPDLKQAAQLVQKSWLAMGAQVTVKVFEPSDLYQNVIRTRKYDALLFGELIGKDRDLYAFWHSSQRNAPGLNVALYANSAADKLLESIRATGDDATRNAQYAQFEKMIQTDVPAVFLYVPDFTYVVPKALHDISLNTITVSADRWDSISSWYLATENVWKIFAKKQ